MKAFSLVNVFRRRPVRFVSTPEISPQDALGLLRRKAEVLRCQATNFSSLPTLYKDVIDRAHQAEQAATQCEQLLERQNYSAVRRILADHGIDTPVSSS